MTASGLPARPRLASSPSAALAAGALVVLLAVALVALSYAIVTGLLVGVYAGLVLLATQALNIRTPVMVAVATLAVAALFNPLRQQVQRAVDRRFNRARYDADKAIAVFAARLQDAVDLDTVHADLLEAVHQTLEPAHSSVWIRP